MRVALAINRTKLPLKFYRRTSFRNSRTRAEMSGYANYERVLAVGLDFRMEWGIFDPSKPDHSKLGRVDAARKRSNV